jgi:hypothetical protein
MQQLTQQMIQDVLQTAFKEQYRVWSVLRWLVPLMCQLPQAHGMQLSSVLGWLQFALARSSKEVTAALCSWLDSYAAQVGIEPPGNGFGGYVMEEWCSLLDWDAADPGNDVGLGANFGSREAECLLAAALPTGTGGSLAGLEAVCSLPCVRLVAEARTVARLLESTLAAGSLAVGVVELGSVGAAATQLLQLPAAAGMSAPELAQLLVSLLQHCSHYAVVGQLHSHTPTVIELLKKLRSMPAMKDLSCEMIKDVLNTACYDQQDMRPVLQELVPLMRQLPQAQGMQLDSMLEWCSATDLYQQLVRLTQPAAAGAV